MITIYQLLKVCNLFINTSRISHSKRFPFDIVFQIFSSLAKEDIYSEFYNTFTDKKAKEIDLKAIEYRSKVKSEAEA